MGTTKPPKFFDFKNLFSIAHRMQKKIADFNDIIIFEIRQKYRKNVKNVINGLMLCLIRLDSLFLLNANCLCW